MLTDENGNALGGGVFVLCSEDGKVIRNAAGYPSGLYRMDGSPVALSGLEAGTYLLVQLTAPAGYQIAENTRITIPGETEEIKIVNRRKTDTGYSITVSASAWYRETALTAEQTTGYYAALFSGSGTKKTRVSEVKELKIEAGSSEGIPAVFDGLSEGTYQLTATDEYGEPLAQSDEMSVNPTTVNLTASQKKAELSLEFQYGEGYYPEGRFSYEFVLSLSLQTVGRDGKALATKEDFYAAVFRDEEYRDPVSEEPIRFSMNGDSTLKQEYRLKLYKAEETYYLAETDSEGTPVKTGEGFAYTVTIDNAGTVAVSCGAVTPSASVGITNRLNDSTVLIRVEDASSGSLLPGALLALKDSSGKIIEISGIGSKTFSSLSQELKWTNYLNDGETYYLTEIRAPEGYSPASDLAFTVRQGETTEVVLQNTRTAATGYSLEVSKEVYVGDTQVYAYDTTAGENKAAGAYTYYAALFSDAKYTKKVSDVLSIEVSGFKGSVTFENLKKGAVYYVAETDAFGVVKSSSDKLTVRYTKSGKVTMPEKSRSMVIQNVYSSLPAGYRYTGTLTITKNVANSEGEAEAVNKTFTVGIYRHADYSDTPTVVNLTLNGSSSVSVRKRILLSGSSDMTYYLAELDENGNRITDSSDFPYTVTIDNPEVTITRGSNRAATVTNRTKATKATLYITKRVYEGVEKKAVSETFYAGLFQDPSFTKLYADPIPLKLENESELTLRLTLSLGSAAGTTVYVAEVDKDGTVIKNQQEFGYQIKIGNSTAAFSQERQVIRVSLLNSVYGTTSEDDWNQIFSDVGSLDGEYGAFGDNGTASEAVQTGDSSPLALYLGLALSSLAVTGCCLGRRRRKHRG